MALASKANIPKSISQEYGSCTQSRGKGRTRVSINQDIRNPFSATPLCFKLKSSIAGVVIGQGGWRVKEIEDTTNTKIQIQKGTPEAKVKIFGQKEMKLQAKAAIQAVIKKYEEQQTPQNTGPKARLVCSYSAMKRVSGVQVKSSLDWGQLLPGDGWVGHTKQCSGLILDSLLRDNFWWSLSGNSMGC